MKNIKIMGKKWNFVSFWVSLGRKNVMATWISARQSSLTEKLLKNAADESHADIYNILLHYIVHYIIIIPSMCFAQKQTQNCAWCAYCDNKY